MLAHRKGTKMSLVYLRPQWHYHAESGGTGSLVSETMHHPSFSAEHSDILNRLSTGLEVDDLNEDQFKILRDFINRGFVALDASNESTHWELSGIIPQTVEEQLKQNTFSWWSNVSEQSSNTLKSMLLKGGMIEELNDPRISILVADSFCSVPDSALPAIPVILDRVRVSIGPMIFPWRTNVRDIVSRNPAYMKEIKYEVPEPFSTLGANWAAAAILQFIAGSKILYVNNTVEFNVMTMEQKIWPIQF